MSGRRSKFKKNKNRSFWKNPKLLTFVFVLAIIFISVPLGKKLLQKQEINEEIKKLQNEISEIEQENDELDKLIQYLESEHFLEEQARLNLGLKKKGEKVLVIKGEEGVVAGIKEGNNLDQDGSQNDKLQLMKWWNYFFKAD